MTAPRQRARSARPAPATPAPEPSRWATWRQELRQTGEVGKQEWERIFTRWGQQWQTFRSEPLSARAEEARLAIVDGVQQAVAETQRAVQTSWTELHGRIWGKDAPAAK